MRKAGWIAAAAAGTAAVAAAAFYLRERNSEQPEYDLLLDDGALELREYPALIAAETVQRGGRERALGAGFRVLADYVFARSREGAKIAMTAPVLSDRVGAPGDGEWRTRFVMPARWTHATLPPPGGGVAIVDIPARKLAAHRFSGAPDDALLSHKEEELRAWIDVQGIAASGPAEHAFYNSPFIPGPIRRNEILIPV